MYNVRDFVLSNRTVSMADGTKIVFSDHMAAVPDQYIEYFQRISDFHVQVHTDDNPVAPEVESVAPEVVEPDMKESSGIATPPEEVEKKDFKKVTKD